MNVHLALRVNRPETRVLGGGHTLPPQSPQVIQVAFKS